MPFKFEFEANDVDTHKASLSVAEDENRSGRGAINEATAHRKSTTVTTIVTSPVGIDDGENDRLKSFRQERI